MSAVKRKAVKRKLDKEEAVARRKEAKRMKRRAKKQRAKQVEAGKEDNQTHPAETAVAAAQSSVSGRTPSESLTPAPGGPLAVDAPEGHMDMSPWGGQVKDEPGSSPAPARPASSLLNDQEDCSAKDANERESSSASSPLMGGLEDLLSQSGLDGASRLDQKPVECDPGAVTPDVKPDLATPLTSSRASNGNGNGNGAGNNNGNGPKTPSLSDEQIAVLNTVLDGHSVFFTGSAGTGKTALIRAITDAFTQRRYPLQCNECDRRTWTLAELDAMEPPTTLEEEWRYRQLRNDVASWEEGDHRCASRKENTRWILGVTALTGIAARSIGGSTIHAWTGVGPGEGTRDELLGQALKSRPAVSRWQETSALIIDEISMMSAQLMDKLSYIGQRMRNNPRPFGGIQIIASGDFHQLAPIKKASLEAPQFAFRATCWEALFPLERMYVLTQVFRQREVDLRRLLENVKKGRCDPKQEKLLIRLKRPVQYKGGLQPVELFPKRSQVNEANAARLEEIDQPLYRYSARDEPGMNVDGAPHSASWVKSQLDSQTLWPRTLQLKVGALVMLVVNLKSKEGLVNGSTGIVHGFMTIEQALFNGVQIPEISNDAADKDGPHREWPVVDFPDHTGTSTQAFTLVRRMSFTLNGPSGDVTGVRNQVPLILAWAMTIHKSQGQTIPRLRVNLEGVKAHGQAYVALSRAASITSLEVVNFRRQCIHASPEVLEWSKRLEHRKSPVTGDT